MSSSIENNGQSSLSNVILSKIAACFGFVLLVDSHLALIPFEGGKTLWETLMVNTNNDWHF